MTKRLNVRLILAAGWLILTSSLALWWMIFALSLIEQVELGNERHRLMLILEGATLLALLLIGGGLLVYFIVRDRAQTERLKLIFAAFTHDVKTRLSGVKLQIESLRADNRDEKLTTLIERLLTDASRLQVQVENSLYVAADKPKWVESNERQGLDAINPRDSFRFSDLLDILQESWPQIEIKLKGDAILKVERRVFENVITNILHNSISHGEANAIRVQVTPRKSVSKDKKSPSELVEIVLVDNGGGFAGDVKRLGEKFYLHSKTSGSGIGLYTVRQSMLMLGGEAVFVCEAQRNSEAKRDNEAKRSKNSTSDGGSESKSGFEVRLVVPGVVIE